MNQEVVVYDCSDEESTVSCQMCKYLGCMPHDNYHCFYSHNEIGKIKIMSCASTIVTLYVHEYNIYDILKSKLPFECEQDEGILIFNKTSINFEHNENCTLLETNEETINKIIMNIKKIIGLWDVRWV